MEQHLGLTAPEQRVILVHSLTIRQSHLGGKEGGKGRGGGAATVGVEETVLVETN